MVSPDDQLSAVRAAIAAAVLSSLPGERLGDIELWAEQRRIVARAGRALERDGGCLIAEDVGRGKTFIALALAQRWSRRLVIAPAMLRATWCDAMRRAGVPCAFASHESLSRGRSPAGGVDGIIVDESHHYRTPGTRRYAALAAATAVVPVVLLSATPLQNCRRDLAAQVALFLGETAHALDDAMLSRFVIRGGQGHDPRLPVALEPRWVELNADDFEVLSAILALPTPPGPLDGGDAGALRMIALVRAWSSSRAALDAMLRARMRTATAIEQGLDEGRTPSRRELRAWTGGDDAVQLGFAALLMESAACVSTAAHVRKALADERDGIRSLRELMRATEDPDDARAAALRAVRAQFPGERVLVFSERAETVRALYARLCRDAGVGMLTGSAARIASGRLSRGELLERFAPVGQRARALPAHEQVTLLITTDLLSEGMNLQDASVVVHLDLPWNPARLQQRLGRVRRPAGRESVASFLFAPPAGAAARVDAESMLRRKIQTAEQVLGGGVAVLPPLLGSGMSQPLEGDDSTTFGVVLGTIAGWASTRREDASVPLIGAVEGHARGWLAALSDGRLVCALRDHVHENAPALLEACGLAMRTALDLSEADRDTALTEVAAWLVSERIADACGMDSATGPLRRTMEPWLARCIAAAPRHERASVLADAARLRDALRRPLSLGIEQQLAALAGGTLDARAALRRCVVIATGKRDAANAGTPSLAALVVFEADPSLRSG